MSSISSIPSNTPNETTEPTASGNIGEVFRVFLKLGLTSFGGPIAHLGYFRDELVLRRKWIDEAGYVDLIALCQFLPGPASSQVGFSLGILRGNGLLSGLAAWLGFTLPSAVILVAFALGAAAFTGPIAEGFLHGLKLVAVAVVAQAVWGMTRTLTPDRTRAMIALAAIFVVVIVEGSFGQIAAIALSAVAGLRFCRGEAALPSGPLRFPVSRRAGIAALALFVALFMSALLLSRVAGQAVALFEAFYRSGALVFGGGHVVLPLLQAEVVAPGWVTNEAFLAGYGLTQAVPGPLFTFAAYLGAVMGPTPNGVVGAAIALVAIFLPGLLLVYGMLPFWGELRARQGAQAAMRGANAAVVGILGLALYNPICRAHAARLRACGRRIPVAHGLEGSAMDRGPPAGCRRHYVGRDAYEGRVIAFSMKIEKAAKQLEALGNATRLLVLRGW